MVNRIFEALLGDAQTVSPPAQFQRVDRPNSQPTDVDDISLASAKSEGVRSETITFDSNRHSGSITDTFETDCNKTRPSLYSTQTQHWASG